VRTDNIEAGNAVKEPSPEAPDTAQERLEEEAGSVTVREFVESPFTTLDLEVLGGQEGLDKEIRSTRIQKLGMALAGFTDYIDPACMQVIGVSEANYLQALNSEGRIAAIRRLRDRHICCILITTGLEIPEGLSDLSGEEKIPILRCSVPSSISLTKITVYLERRLAPRITIHGVLLEVFGLGVLIMGPSGIGKSECALELVLKGHRLITDDYVELTRYGIDRLSGSGAEVLKHHMELRGLGIINIRELFGISATGSSQNVDFAVRLERWKSDAEYDRIGLDQSTIEYLGVSIPVIDMPVAPGRNIATLVEVAARIQLLRQRGYRPSIQNNEIRMTDSE
jgi:HPr kinase/phosphorylase